MSGTSIVAEFESWLSNMIGLLTVDALANSLATIISVFIGAMLAYYLQSHYQKKLEYKNAQVAAHLLIFALIKQINTIVLIQRNFVFKYLQNPMKFIAIPATATFDSSKNALQSSDLAFLIDIKGGKKILYDFYMAQENYIEAITQWNIRSQLHLEKVQPALSASTLVQGGEYSLNEIESVLGALTYVLIVNSTDNSIGALQRAFEYLYDIKEEARECLTNHFKGVKFSDLDFPEGTYGLVIPERQTKSN